ncbi:MAG: hypothetical protein GF383_08735 [Candidatus Lokiarchaeota archaeon]|nr:hypothetical protein [Candidatus Lokiarchaeota archaeon]MBD3340465.1 hypothetical protein [Candidatus Lokiarchaeota archaeon]
MELSAWFKVKFDEKSIYLDVRPPNREGWDAEIHWQDIVRICFVPGSLFEPDDIYIFIKQRPESFVIPTEADGAANLWSQIINRGLFDAKLAIEAATSTEGLFCWPPD